MTDKHPDGEFADLEKKLRQTLAREKMPGLLPDQLSLLHQKISEDGPTQVEKTPSRCRWFLLTLPSVAIVVMAVNVYRHVEPMKEPSGLKAPPAETLSKQSAPAASSAADLAEDLASEVDSKAKKSADLDKDLLSSDDIAGGAVGAASGAMRSIPPPEGRQENSLAERVAPGVAQQTAQPSKKAQPAKNDLPAEPQRLRDLKTEARYGGRPPVRTVKIVDGSIKTDGAVAIALIRNAIEFQMLEVERCYMHEKVKSTALAGDLHFVFTLDSSGNVSNARLAHWTLSNKAAVECISEKVSKWKFPKKAGTRVEMTLRFPV